MTNKKMKIKKKYIKNVENNVLYVSLGSNTDYLISDSCLIEKVNLLMLLYMY